MSYYAVKTGRKSGIYNNWSDCKESVNGYSGAAYKKFSTPEEAQRFIGESPSTMSASASYRPSRSDSQVVYTDGACERNGQVGSKGGIGVYFGPNHPMNVSEPLSGRQTNNRAEIMAGVRALEQCKSSGQKNVTIKTDSDFMYKGVTEYVPRWKENGWKLANGGDVKNRRDFEMLDQAQQGMNVKWDRVPGHAGNPGNEAADRLARDGARRY